MSPRCRDATPLGLGPMVRYFEPLWCSFPWSAPPRVPAVRRSNQARPAGTALVVFSAWHCRCRPRALPSWSSAPCATLVALRVSGEFASGLASSATTLLDRWKPKPRASSGTTAWYWRGGVALRLGDSPTPGLRAHGASSAVGLPSPLQRPMIDVAFSFPVPSQGGIVFLSFCFPTGWLAWGRPRTELFCSLFLARRFQAV